MNNELHHKPKMIL